MIRERGTKVYGNTFMQWIELARVNDKTKVLCTSNWLPDTQFSATEDLCDLFSFLNPPWRSIKPLASDALTYLIFFEDIFFEKITMFNHQVTVFVCWSVCLCVCLFIGQSYAQERQTRTTTVPFSNSQTNTIFTTHIVNTIIILVIFHQ